MSTQSVDRPEPLLDTTQYNQFMRHYVNCESSSAVELMYRTARIGDGKDRSKFVGHEEAIESLQLLTRALNPVR